MILLNLDITGILGKLQSDKGPLIKSSDTKGLKDLFQLLLKKTISENHVNANMGKPSIKGSTLLSIPSLVTGVTQINNKTLRINNIEEKEPSKGIYSKGPEIHFLSKNTLEAVFKFLTHKSFPHKKDVGMPGLLDDIGSFALNSKAPTEREHEVESITEKAEKPLLTILILTDNLNHKTQYLISYEPLGLDREGIKEGAEDKAILKNHSGKLYRKVTVDNTSNLSYGKVESLKAEEVFSPPSTQGSGDVKTRGSEQKNAFTLIRLDIPEELLIESGSEIGPSEFKVKINELIERIDPLLNQALKKNSSNIESAETELDIGKDTTRVTSYTLKSLKQEDKKPRIHTREKAILKGLPLFGRDGDVQIKELFISNKGGSKKATHEPFVSKEQDRKGKILLKRISPLKEKPVKNKSTQRVEKLAPLALKNDEIHTREQVDKTHSISEKKKTIEKQQIITKAPKASEATKEPSTTPDASKTAVHPEKQILSNDNEWSDRRDERSDNQSLNNQKPLADQAQDISERPLGQIHHKAATHKNSNIERFSQIVSKIKEIIHNHQNNGSIHSIKLDIDAGDKGRIELKVMVHHSTVQADISLESLKDLLELKGNITNLYTSLYQDGFTPKEFSFNLRQRGRHPEAIMDENLDATEKVNPPMVRDSLNNLSIRV